MNPSRDPNKSQLENRKPTYHRQLDKERGVLPDANAGCVRSDEFSRLPGAFWNDVAKNDAKMLSLTALISLVTGAHDGLNVSAHAEVSDDFHFPRVEQFD